jgi:hypothetical protein
MSNVALRATRVSRRAWYEESDTLFVTLARARSQRQDAETRKRIYFNQTIHGGLKGAQVHLNRMFSGRVRSPDLGSFKQTLNWYLDR